MNFHIVSPDAAGRVDPPVLRILKHLPPGDGTRVTVVPVTRLENFKFSLQFGGPWVLWDHSELGWDWDQERGYNWTENRTGHQWFQTDDWKRFDEFVRKYPPICTFQRELLEADRRPYRLPAEYLNYWPEVNPQSKDEFMARPIDVCYQWGRSSESRVRLHANIFRQSSYRGYPVVSEMGHVENELREGRRGLWCTMHTPHYARRDIREVVEMFNKSKIVVSMAGCGQKTFRGGEIPDSIIAFPKDNLAWGIPYDSGKNCLRMSTGLGPNSIVHDRENVEIGELCEMLARNDLYDVYRRAVEVADRLRPERYMGEYVVPAIQRNLK